MNQSNRRWTVYLAGEIHSDWREVIARGIADRGLPVDLTGPVTDHDASDDCGERILGKQPTPFWRDHTGAKINAIRTRGLLGRADLVVVRFGDKYRQWNAAFDAGQALAKGIPYITLHDASLTHALKEVDAGAQAVCEQPGQVVEILAYLIAGRFETTA